MVKLIEPIEDSLAELKTSRSDSVKLHTMVLPTSSQLYAMYSHLIKRSYEEPYKWYYIVFKPFNDSYNAMTYANCLSKCSDWIRPKTTAGLGILSREIESAKIHVNALIVSDNDLLALNNTNKCFRGLKYKLSVQCLSSLEDRHNVLTYMFKEANDRDFILYQDHMSYDRSNYSDLSNKKVTYMKYMMASAPCGYTSDDPDDTLQLKRRLF